MMSSTTNTTTSTATTTAAKARSRSVRFANTAQLYIFTRHKIVARHRQDLWYSKSEYYSMRRAVEQDILEIRAQALVGIPLNYAGDDDSSAFESSVCCVGIENHLTPAFILETMAGRARSILAVLQTQGMQDASEMDIAQASISKTKEFALRARLRGSLLHKITSDSI
mmetsp:Transcript_22452/g.32075  ORF Transcript_22452/g.32075 Transcript_22452/m.32075 type:complete len:168 (-) Transcript_22452:95-598(-)|eukprot:CAMPEP_0201693132 /NCGR_PEP_ID=MMETSP0578-20130828/5814_1 /ASSEMBLY_ACC=CAM_ASM_000663 /TAXON_ID=267565 /ORGANISM="Skeletonema grethea, Strain CCMP 1804" /LENGTH=167 /DNA_ID=CAMNT_0048178609 /DNA_START=118 /DNA_END=621 /DNA_ORIENTATION=+